MENLPRGVTALADIYLPGTIFCHNKKTRDDSVAKKVNLSVK
jgi:hypothetical protein